VSYTLFSLRAKTEGRRGRRGGREKKLGIRFFSFPLLVLSCVRKNKGGKESGEGAHAGREKERRGRKKPQSSKARSLSNNDPL
jgi:hypothetical protein